MLLQGQVGQILATDGAQNIMRQGRTGEIIASQAHGVYHEQASRSTLFSLTMNAAVTSVVAGNIVGAAANAATQFALWNPAGSGVNLALMRTSVGIISATTMATGPVFHGLFVLGNPTNSSTFDSGKGAVNNVPGGRPPIARYINTATTGTTITGGTAPITFRAMPYTFSATGFAAAAGTQCTDFLDGDIVIPPGYGWVPLFGAAGTAVIVAYSVTWEEVPI
jgi:hypothetical protein